MRKSTRVTKTEKVLEHLQKYGSITSWEAIEKYGATRLSAIIFNLRKKYKIENCCESFTDRYGNNSIFVKYVFCGSR